MTLDHERLLIMDYESTATDLQLPLHKNIPVLSFRAWWMLDILAATLGNKFGALPALAFRLALGLRSSPPICDFFIAFSELIVKSFPLGIHHPILLRRARG